MFKHLFFASVNITVLGLTNPDVNLKRMHQLYNVSTNIYWQVIKLGTCSAHMSVAFVLVTNFKMPTIVGILKFMTRTNVIVYFSEQQNRHNRLSFDIYEIQNGMQT